MVSMQRVVYELKFRLADRRGAMAGTVDIACLRHIIRAGGVLPGELVQIPVRARLVLLPRGANDAGLGFVDERTSRFMHCVSLPSESSFDFF